LPLLHATIYGIGLNEVLIMASPTLQEQLEAVENAIFALVNGALQYSINNRTVRRENLKELREWRDALKVEIGRATYGPSRNFTEFKRPS